MGLSIFCIYQGLRVIKNAKCLNFKIFKIPDNDLKTRRIGQKVDPVTGIVYVKDVYNPEKIEPPVRNKPKTK